MKTCPRCETEKALDCFGRNASRADGRQTYCRLCVKEYNRDYYTRTPERNGQRHASRARSRIAAREFVWKYLAEHPCVDCGEADVIVLEADHVLGEKDFNIADGVGAGYGVDRIATELEKCEIRCANCHRRATARRAGWARTLLP